MNELSVILCSWCSPHLLKPCIDSILAAQGVDTKIIVTLNQADTESQSLLSDYKIDYVSLPDNRGVLSVDCGSGMINSEYVVNINDDMLFHPGWDKILIGLIKNHYPCSASCHLVEPYGTNNHIVNVDNLGDFTKAREAFVKNQAVGKYKIKDVISYTHPIMVKTTDYFRVGRYSDNFDTNWFPGYGLDDWWAYRLYKSQPNFKCIASGEACVYHGISLTNAKLNPQDRNRSGRAYFHSKTGMTIEQFRQSINIFSPIS